MSAEPSFAPIHRLTAANLFAQSAEQVALAAAPLVAVLALGAGAWETSWLQAAQTLPFLLLSLPAGLLADRVSRRRLMGVGEGLRAAALMAILLAAAMDTLTLPLLAVLGFIGACGTVAFNVATPSLVQGLVPRAALGLVNGRLELARALAFSAGPAVGGALVAWLGGSAAFGVAAGCSLAATTLIWRLPEPARTVAPRRHIATELKAGAAFVLGHRLLRPVLLTAILFNTAFFVLLGIYVPYAVTHLGLDAQAVGLTLAVYGVGMICGAMMARWVMDQFAFGTVVIIGPVCGFLAALVMAGSIVVPSFWLAAASFFLIGIGPMIWTVSTTTLRQAVTPPAMLGRASAVVLTATFGARPLGALIGGAVAGTFWGAPAAILVAAGGFLLQMVVILASPARALRRLPDDSDDDGAAAPKSAPRAVAA